MWASCGFIYLSVWQSDLFLWSSINGGELLAGLAFTGICHCQQEQELRTNLLMPSPKPPLRRPHPAIVMFLQYRRVYRHKITILPLFCGRIIALLLTRQVSYTIKMAQTENSQKTYLMGCKHVFVK